jgi:hypothetical protein
VVCASEVPMVTLPGHHVSRVFASPSCSCKNLGRWDELGSEGHGHTDVNSYKR